MTRRYVPVPLLQFVSALSPKFSPPLHLAALVDLFERAEAGEEVRATVSAPPRHGKSESLKHAIVKRLRAQPDARIGLASYAATRAQKISREVRVLYERSGGHVQTDAKAKGDWRTTAEPGGVWACGIDGGMTGEGFDLLVIDDPIKDRARAESGIERERLWDWFVSVALTRMEPRGSVIIDHARWTTDDLIGRLALTGNWEHVNLPAINSRGEALWPARYPIDKLRKLQEQLGAYVFESLYQGNPFSKGGRLFSGDVLFYDAVPAVPMAITLGLDFAYSSKSRSDWSVAIVLGRSGEEYFILDCVRMQSEAPAFLARARALQERWGGAQAHAYTGGQERGMLDVMVAMGGKLDLRTTPATQDKFARVQPFSAAWNRGAVRVPRDADWLDDVVNELRTFTGIRDPHDDIVDACAAAFDAQEQLALAAANASPPAPEYSIVNSHGGHDSATVGSIDNAIDLLSAGLFVGE